MRRGAITFVLALSGLASGCLNIVVPGHDSGPDFGLRTAGQTPAQDLGRRYAADPRSDGGAALRFADIQAVFDAQGCTTSQCHGGTQVPVLVPKPASNAVALSNYYDLLDGCANGTPDSADCIDIENPDQSLLLAKTCATTNVSHAGGKPFADDKDPTYVQWLAWIAADAPY